jgi:glycosyltransferase involved in cell wall biosynthesis
MKELTILMPCLNEAETLGTCIERAKMLLADNGIDGEMLIADNGSTDGSQDLARRLGARVVNCPVRGYGAALMCGIEAAEGRFVIMGDSDDSYHFDEAMPMVEKLRGGADVCMGTRLKGTIVPGAMPFLNRYLGNPVLTAIGRLFFGITMSDFHSGLRGFRRDRILGIDLVTTGMEWASEMVIKARLAGLSMTEVPVTLYRDGRSRRPHLKRWRDGWRHLRFMLLHAPTWLFTIPGLAMVITGLIGQVLLYHGMVRIGPATLDVHSMLVLSFLSVLGAQVVFTGLFARFYSGLNGILPYDEKFDRMLRRLSLEKLLAVSVVLGLLGAAGFFSTLWQWYRSGFAPLDYQVTMRRLIPALTLIAFAVQGIFNGFMLFILFLKTKCPPPGPGRS